MNLDLFKVSDNQFAVADNDDNIRIITSNEDKDIIVQILTKENSLEKAIYNLKVANNDIVKFKNNEYARKFTNVLLSSLSIFFTIIFIYFNMIITLIGFLLSFMIIKAMMCCIYGTKKKNNNNLSITRFLKDKTLCEINNLTIDIDNLKEKAIFKEEEKTNATLDDYIDFYLDNDVIELEKDNHQESSKSKRRVRKLNIITK